MSTWGRSYVASTGCCIPLLQSERPRPCRFVKSTLFILFCRVLLPLFYPGSSGPLSLFLLFGSYYWSLQGNEQYLHFHFTFMSPPPNDFPHRVHWKPMSETIELANKARSMSPASDKKVFTWDDKKIMLVVTSMTKLLFYSVFHSYNYQIKMKLIHYCYLTKDAQDIDWHPLWNQAYFWHLTTKNLILMEIVMTTHSALQLVLACQNNLFY